MEELLKLNFTSTVWVFLLPLILMTLDVITGYYNAWKNNKVSSAKMRDGLGKKCAELVCIAVGTAFKFAFGINAAMYFFAIYVCYMEIVSLAENCSKLGLPLTNVITDKFKLNIDNEKNKEE